MSNELSEIFNIRPIEVITTQSHTVVPDGSEDEDFLYARTQTYNLIEKGSEALDIAIKICRESENPRAIEVLSGLVKNLSEVNKALVVLNKDKAEAKSAKIGQSTANGIQNGMTNNTQNNIIFTGNSKLLNQLLAEQMNSLNNITPIIEGA